MHFHTLPLRIVLFQPGLMLNLPVSWVGMPCAMNAALAMLHCYI